MHLKTPRLITSLVSIGTLASVLLAPLALAESPAHTHSSAASGMNHGHDKTHMGGEHDKDHMDHHGMKMTGDVDHDFATMMRMHHEKGIKMAQVELDKGKDREMRAAAKKIIDSQTKELAEFDKWLAAHPPKTK